MSATNDHVQGAGSDAGSHGVDLKLEAVVIPVADADRAKAFYAKLGWRLDADFALPCQSAQHGQHASFPAEADNKNALRCAHRAGAMLGAGITHRSTA